MTFPTTTAGLVLLGDWLVAEHVTLVGMASTGLYWKPVFFLLEQRIPVVRLLNAGACISRPILPATEPMNK